MSLILKQEPANTISTPPAGKSTLFITDSSVMAVKTPSGDVTLFPTVQGSNTQVLFNDAGAINGNANLVFNKTNSTLTVANLSVTGTLNAGDISVSSIANGTSNVDIIGISGNVTTSVAGVANVLVVTTTGANITGNLSASGNITALNFIGNIAGSANSAITAGTVTTAAQPNITSTGTLTSLSSSGNITGANLITGGNVYTENIVNITANTSIGMGNGSGIVAIYSAGNATQFAPSGQITLGGASQIVGGTFGGSGITAAGTQTDIFQNRGGNVTVQVGTGGTIANTWTFTNSGNLLAPGAVSATGNVTGANLITGGIVSATGNVTASFFIGNGSQLTGLNTASVSNGNSNVNVTTANGNVTIAAVGNTTMTITGTGANISGTLSASGNITGDNILGNGYALTGIRPQVTATNSGGALNIMLASGINGASNAVVGIGTSGGPATINPGTGQLVVAGATVGGYGLLVDGGGQPLTGTVSATGNITGANFITAGLISATGNATVGNISATNHTGTTVTVTGNVTGGNLVTAGVLSVTGTGVSSIAGNLDMTSNTIINLATPTNSTDAATKQYVDDVAQGLNIHDSCNAATTATLATISGGTVTYNNGASGVGANLTTTGSFNLIDGVNVQSAGTRILVKNEANAAHNGIYTWSNTTVITRATDFNSVPEVEAGDFTFVTAGTTYDNTGWVQTSSVTTIGTDAIEFTQFSGAGTYTAGTGLTLTGSVFSVNVAQPTITSVGTLTSLSVTGNINAGNVSATTFTGALSGAATSATTAGTVTTAAQGNITSVGTLTSLAVTGNITAGNISATNHTGTTSNITGQYITTLATGTAPFVVTSTTQVANLNVASAGLATFATTANAVAGGNVSGTVANATFATSAGSATTAGTVTTAAQGNITSVGTLTSVSVSGNANVGNLGTGGLITATGNLNAGNIITGGIVSATGNITGGNITTTGNISANTMVNIFSYQGTSATITGNITGGNIISTTNHIFSVATGISAAGSTQGTATAISKDFNVVSTVSASQGVTLPTAVAGMRITIINTSATALNVYPLGNGIINTQSANVAFSQPATSRLDFICTANATAPGGQWYTLNATYS